NATTKTYTDATIHRVDTKITKTFQSLSYFCRFVGEAITLKHDQEYDLLIVDYDPLMENTEAEDETGWNCSVHPSVFFLLEIDPDEPGDSEPWSQGPSPRFSLEFGLKLNENGYSGVFGVADHEYVISFVVRYTWRTSNSGRQAHPRVLLSVTPGEPGTLVARPIPEVWRPGFLDPQGVTDNKINNVFMISGSKNPPSDHFRLDSGRIRVKTSGMGLAIRVHGPLGTLVLTTCATGMLCGAIMTDHWEEVTWDKDSLGAIANSTVKVQWLLDKTVARVSTNDAKERTIAFLVPMHGGIWTLCVSLTNEEISLLQQVGFPSVQPCINYLSGGIEGVRSYEPRADWQHRMQNLSISCALVCLIILGSAALVGAFGVFQHQISAVLVTGVMYLLAASFSLFTLTIIHFKRLHSKPNENDGAGAVDGVVSPMGSRGVKELLPARVFTTSWSLDLGWGGVMLCVMTSVLWILLSKIMRFNPISSMIHY
ncbi:hypothetical protein NQ318_014031, partial [Aromia moschata]